MMLNNHTLIFSLMLISALMAIGLFTVASRFEREGLRLWGAAMAMLSIGWICVDARGSIPDIVSITFANTLFSASISLELAAVYEYRGLSYPRWQCVVPVLVTMLVFSLLAPDDLRDHLLVSSLILGTQFLMLAIALYRESDSHSGHAWQLLFAATLIMLPMLALRGLATHFGNIEFANVRSTYMPNPIQLATYICVMGTITLGSLGFILMTKERADREIQNLALTDPLTRLLNRRAFFNLAAQELAFSRRNGVPLALIMLDVDHFKHINDHHGHLVGDDVLIELSRLLTMRLRSQDILGRYGGEEFCILLPNTDDASAHIVAESLRTAVEFTVFAPACGGISVTVSLGLTAFEPSGTNSDDTNLTHLIEGADTALYQAKREGRNRTSTGQLLLLPQGAAVEEEPSAS